MTVPGPPVFKRAAAPIGIGSYADREHYTVEEEIALADAKVRSRVAYAIATAFVLANVLTLIGIAIIFYADNANLVAKVINPADRVITPQVIMTVAGATTVQLGALVLIMGKYLFPAPSR